MNSEKSYTHNDLTEQIIGGVGVGPQMSTDGTQIKIEGDYPHRGLAERIFGAATSRWMG